MSFLKTNDPAKRDSIVKEFLKTKKNIRDRQIAEKTKEIDLQSDLSKFFKPITDTQKATTEKITEVLEPIKEGMKKLPNYPSIRLFTDEEGQITMGEDKTRVIGPIAFKYLIEFADKSAVDKTYGLYSKNGKFYIGNKEIAINNNDIVLDDKVYEGTPGVWELITSRIPDPKIFTDEDYKTYSKIVVKSNTLFRNNDSSSIYPKSSRGAKWQLLRHIWEVVKPKKGGGIIIPCDPNALVRRLHLLLASKAAGNTGVRNEIVGICDELKRQGHLDEKSYKSFMSILQKDDRV